MKKNVFQIFNFFISIVLLFSFVSCDEEDDITPEEKVCIPEGDFIEYSEVEEKKLTDLLVTSLENPWQVSSFTINGDDIADDYASHNFTFAREGGGTTGILFSKIYAPGNSKISDHDAIAAYYSAKGEDGNLTVNMVYKEQDGKTVYEPFRKSYFYKVVKGATTERFELRACTRDTKEQMAIVFTKKATCTLEGEFIAHSEAEEEKLTDLLVTSLENPWQISSFAINGEDLEDDYTSHNFTFAREGGGTTGTLFSRIYAPGNTKDNAHDAITPCYFMKGDDGSLMVNLVYKEKDGETVYEPLRKSQFYKVVKGATSVRFELKACTTDTNEQMAIVFTKKETCTPEGNFIAYSGAEVDNLQDLLSNTLENPWEVSSFTINGKDLTADYESHEFTFADPGVTSSQLIAHAYANDNKTYYPDGYGIYYMQPHDDGTLIILMQYGEKKGGTVYEPFRRSFLFRVVTGATSEKFELRACTTDTNEQMAIVFEKD